MKPQYRMFVDEVGSAQMKSIRTDNERYLCLVGTILDIAGANSQLRTGLESFKTDYFDQHCADDPVVLHRVDIRNRTGHYAILNNEFVRQSFDRDLLSLLTEIPYTVIAIGVDKLAHQKHYSFPNEPYHYSMECLIERYVRFLQDVQSVGDILIESRNSSNDRALQSEYSRIYIDGTGPRGVDAEAIQRHLTSSQLKFKRKDQNIAGLQLVDLVSHPSLRYLLIHHRGDNQLSGFSQNVINLLEESKFRRRKWDGRIEGYGTKWLN